MKKGWQKIEFKYLCSINDLNIGRKYPHKEITYLDITSVGTGTASFENVIALHEAPSRAKRIPLNGDTILATVRPGNKSFYYCQALPENTVVSTGFAVIHPNDEFVEKRFLYYLIAEPSFTAYLVSNEKGANYPAVTPDVLTRAKILLPSLVTQRKISYTLSSYDDLIDNNHKRIKLLEEIAQITFNEWFAKKKGLPQGWKEKNLGALVEHEIGGGWGEDNKSHEFSEAAYVIRGTDIDEIPFGKIEDVPFRYHKKSNLASRKLRHGDIVFEVSGGSSFEGVAKTLLITDELLKQFEGDVMCASFSKLLRPATVELSNFVFLFLRFLRAVRGTEVFEIRSASNIVNYNWTAFLKFQKVKVPDEKTLGQFNEIIDPIYKQIYTLGHQNRLLKEARDILLPRLMTGMIEV